MKFFVVSDIHGCYPALIEGLEKVFYDPKNKDHQIISCGDMFGRAEKEEGSKGVWEYLNSEIHFNKPILIFGNHEDILIGAFERGYLDYYDCYNGESRTIGSFIESQDFLDRTDPKNLMIVRDILEEELLKLPFFYETKNYIFTHGWLPIRNDKIPRNFSIIKDRKKWADAMWGNTPYKIELMKKNQPKGLSKTLVFGHWHASDLHEKFPDGQYGNKIWQDNELKLIGIDCCTVRSETVEVLVLEDEKIK